MIISFVFPSPPQWTGGVILLYEFANGLARRGHEVHFIHGSSHPMRVDRLEDLPPFLFDPAVEHHLVDSLLDESLPTGDVVMMSGGPPKLGLPAVFVQGFRMMPLAWERDTFRARAPKFCVASWLIDVGARMGVPQEQMFLVPPGIDHSLFRNTTSPADRPEDIAVLYNPHHEKGWDVALRALELVAAQRPRTQGIVFGRSVPPETLPGGFRFIRSPDQRQLVAHVYNRSKLMVQASHNEGFGLTAVEAMACGCALVTTDNGGSRDYAIPGETAITVPRGDADSLAAGVLVALGDHDLRQRLATAATALVKRFDWDDSAAVLEHHLEGYLEDPSG